MDAAYSRVSTSNDCGATAPFVSVVVPCYNETATLYDLHRRISAVCSQLVHTFEIVLVNDGSTDNTWAVMQELCAVDQSVRALNLSRNFGQQAALTAGLMHARGDRVLILDADLQDPPELLPEMLALLEDGVDVVYGRRRCRRGETLTKRATASVFYRVLNALSDVPIACDTGEFRLMTRRVVDCVLALPERHRFVRGLVSWVGFRQSAIEYDRSERMAGTSHWPFRKMIRLASDAVTSFSRTPLMFAAWSGVVVATIGFAFLIWFSFAAVFSGRLIAGVGYSGVACILLGAQMIMLGVLGIYVGKLYEESKCRPLFIVSDLAGSAVYTTPLPGDRMERTESVTRNGSRYLISTGMSQQKNARHY